MIVEFIGVTGAGKTALTEASAQVAVGNRVQTVDDVLLDRFLSRRIRNSSVKNLLYDMMALPFFLRSLRRHRGFVMFAIRHLADHGLTTFAKLNYMRSIVRRVGLFELLNRRHADEVILVDEGTVLIAYLLFVYTRTEPTSEEIMRFCRLVPVPDGLVFVEAPLPDLIERAVTRPDARRELKSREPEGVRELIERASSLFDGLVRAAPWKDRVLKVVNGGTDVEEMKSLAFKILEFSGNLSNPAASVDPGRPPRPEEAE